MNLTATSGVKTDTGTGVLIKTGDETRDEKEPDCFLSPPSLSFPHVIIQQNLALKTTFPSEKLEIEKSSKYYDKKKKRQMKNKHQGEKSCTI